MELYIKIYSVMYFDYGFVVIYCSKWQ